MNSLTAAELKRRGMAAIEDGLRHGPVHLMKHNKPSAVVLSEEDYARLAQGKAGMAAGMTAVQLAVNPASHRHPTQGPTRQGAARRAREPGVTFSLTPAP